MATEVILPRVDMDMTEGKIALWHVKNGDSVTKGQVLFEIETDKAAMEVDAPADGVIEGLTGEVGAVLPVGQIVAWIVAPGEARPADAAVAVAPDQEERAAPPVLNPAPAASPGRADAWPLRATPLARSLARQRGLDLPGLTGSGPRGRITAIDLPAAANPAAAPLHLHWWHRGEGAPLVLIHGFGADHSAWRALVRQLPAGTPVLGIDLPCHGKSGLQAVESLGALAEMLRQRLAQEQVSACHLLGHSLGGAVALALASALASAQPALLRSVTLLACAGLGREINHHFIDGLLDAACEAELKAVLALLFVDAPAVLTKAFVAASFEQLRAPGRQAALRQMARQLMPEGRQTMDLRAALAAIEAPVKLVWGLDDRILPAAQSAGVAGRIALHLLPGVGHLPQLEATALVAELVGQQLRAGS